MREARGRAGLTQRQLSAKANVPQPTIARIEGGSQAPLFETVRRLLDACGHELRSVQVRDEDANGVDLSLIRAQLRLSPAERARRAVGYGRARGRLRSARLVGPAG